MQDLPITPPPVTNPFSAMSQVFYQPKRVFDTLALRDNWSWVPFFLLCTAMFFPAYLYYSVVDFDWWREAMVNNMLGDVSPGEKSAMINATTLETTRLSSAILMGFVSPIIGCAALAFYYNIVTRNDEKSIQGFSDWYGAMWWMAMPSIISALLAVIILTFTEANTQILDNVLSPLSLAFVVGSTIDSSWHNLLTFIRLDYIWVAYLAYVGLQSWTNFSREKAIITACAPFLLFLVVFTVMGFY